MATSALPIARPENVGSTPAEPLLEPGDRLSRGEFERRYERMPNVQKAELIEGIVYMPSPIRAANHAIPQGCLATWLGVYVSETPGVQCAFTPTVRLDLDNEPQPDLVLFILPEKGGQTRISADDYIEGAPELVVEIVGSSSAYDLHQKKGAYRRNGVREYLAWITAERRLVWWELKDGEYHEIARSGEDLFKSGVFPGLWLDAQALLHGDKKKMLDVLRQGLNSDGHRAFLASV
jgi:Uma2 family endonuclease